LFARWSESRRDTHDEVPGSGASVNFLDYVCAEQAFMAVQMQAIEPDDRELEDSFEALARSLENDERQSPQQFRQPLENRQSR